MKCSFSRLLYPKTIEETRDGSFMIALYRPHEKVLDAHGEKITSVKVVGHYLPTVHNLKINMTGHWKKDPKFGLQFEMESYEELIEPGKKGIVSYLSSGLISGIGPKIAEKIYGIFGDSSLDVLDENPDRIKDVPGIGEKTRERIRQSYMETRGARKLMTLLAPYEVSTPQVIQLQREMGANAIEMITQHPYELYELDLISFEVADKLGQAHGFPKDAPARLQAGLIYTLRRAENSGHLFMHKEQFVEEAARLLYAPEVTWKLVAQCAFEMLKAGKLVLYHDQVYRPIMAQAERETAERIQAMLKDNKLPFMGDLDDEIDDVQKKMGIVFAAEQRDAIKTALTSMLCVISGGPGTGKTSSIQGILDIYQKLNPDADIVCCAPTGRAARRVTESSGFPAYTVHKAVGVQTGEIKELEPPELLEADLVLVDEVSMLDMVTTWHLFQAIPPGCRLILVGDADQLPSVGPGAVLKELLECGQIPVVVLDKVFRQSEGSTVAVNARAVRHGEVELLYNKEDFQFWASDSLETSAEWLSRLYLQEVARYGVDNVTLLTPFRRKTETGVVAMNNRLHPLVNPPSASKPELEVGRRLFRVGDKLMQTRNKDYASNGDIGYVRSITQEGEEYTVELDFGDGRIVPYEDTESLSQLERAYATTIHKSQGGEYDSVLINIQSAHRHMLNRSLFYTAITRAKRRVIIVGEYDAILRAIRTTDTERRNTLLGLRIRELMEQGGK